MQAPFIQKSVEQPQSSKKRSGNPFLTFFAWAVSLGIWGIIGYLTVYIYILNWGNVRIEDIQALFYILGGLYFIYLIIEFCSPTCRYLVHKRSNEGIRDKMRKIFVTHPEIIFHAECYHYETRTRTYTDEDGHERTETETVKVVTHTESKNFEYCSVRDVSGLLNLKCDKAQIKRKCYIKLELKEEINFADAISIADYERQKEAFKDRNRGYDEYMDFSETRRLPGITHHNLIKFGEYDPCTVNCFWYFIFTIFSLGQLYKWHVSSFSVFQSYKIRKIISTRYNLSSALMDQKYRLFNPQINLITLKIDYDTRDYTFYEPSNDLQIPTEAELELAKKYDAQVPKYEIYDNTCGDIYRCGTVKDNPDFHVYDNVPDSNIIPDGPISSNAINTQGNIPTYIPPSTDSNTNTNTGYNSTDQGYNSYNSSAQGNNNQGGNLPNAGGVY